MVTESTIETCPGIRLINDKIVNREQGVGIEIELKKSAFITADQCPVV